MSTILQANLPNGVTPKVKRSRKKRENNSTKNTMKKERNKKRKRKKRSTLYTSTVGGGGGHTCDPGLFGRPLREKPSHELSWKKK